MKAHASEEVWFGLEQEYTLFDQYDYPYGWPKGGFSSRSILLWGWYW